MWIIVLCNCYNKISRKSEAGHTSEAEPKKIYHFYLFSVCMCFVFVGDGVEVCRCACATACGWRSETTYGLFFCHLLETELKRSSLAKGTVTLSHPCQTGPKRGLPRRELERKRTHPWIRRESAQGNQKGLVQVHPSPTVPMGSVRPTLLCSILGCCQG